MDAPSIVSVTPLQGRRLLVTFANGAQKMYDCRRILQLERFRLLRHDAFFNAVAVDPGGYGVSWNDDMDLSEYELWSNGVQVKPGVSGNKHAPVGQRKERSMPKWESYQEVAAYLLDRWADHFGLARVEGRQEVVGKRSGTTWEIDAKGFRQGDSGFVIVECRRYLHSRQHQEQVGGLAYRIIDAGAQSGIIVSPLGLQEGAKRVAAAENIVSVQLNANSTPYEHVLRFLNEVMVGVSDAITLKDSVTIEATDQDGNIIHRVSTQ